MIFWTWLNEASTKWLNGFKQIGRCAADEKKNHDLSDRKYAEKRNALFYMLIYFSFPHSFVIFQKKLPYHLFSRKGRKGRKGNGYKNWNSDSFEDKFSMSFCIFSLVILAYICVVFMFVCPNILLTVSIGTPFSNVIVVAKVCRARWKVKFLLIPHRSAISFK